MKRLQLKKSWECYWCDRLLKKTWDTKRKTIMWQVIYVCLKCWYNNSPSIFQEYIEVEKQNLIFKK